MIFQSRRGNFREYGCRMMFPSVLWKQTVKFAYEIPIEGNRLKIVIFSDFNRFFNRLIDFFDRSIKIDKSFFLIERKTMHHSYNLQRPTQHFPPGNQVVFPSLHQNLSKIVHFTARRAKKLLISSILLFQASKRRRWSQFDRSCRAG